MLYIKSLEQAVPVFKALGSDIRIRLIQTLLEHQEMNMNELASSLGITNGALTSHVKKLEESGILAILPEHSLATETRRSVALMLTRSWLILPLTMTARLRTVTLLTFRSATTLIILSIQPVGCLLPIISSVR